jgi:hypothetical protein
MTSLFKTFKKYFQFISRKKNMNREIDPFYYHFNLESTKILEGYCIGYKFGDSTDIIVKNIQEYVNEKYSNWLKNQVESEFELFCSSRQSSISAYIMWRLYTLLNKNKSGYASESLSYFFLKISLMKHLAVKIESELLLRPNLMYPTGVAERANWNMFIPAYAAAHSFLAENLYILDKNGEKIHGWRIFEFKENLSVMNKTFYLISPNSCFVMKLIFKRMQNVKRSPQIPRPASAALNNTNKIKNYCDNGSFALYFET